MAVQPGAELAERDLVALAQRSGARGAIERLPVGDQGARPAGVLGHPGEVVRDRAADAALGVAGMRAQQL